MDIQTEKTALIKRMEQINDLSLIKALRHMVDDGLAKKEESISIDQYNEELDKANDRIDSGIFVSHHDVKEDSKTWF